MPHTHDIAVLVTLVKDSGFSWSEEFDQAADLTIYAVATRYPGPTGEISEPEYQQAVLIAQQVLTWAESMIEPDRPPEADQTLDSDLQVRPEEQA